MNWIAKLLGKTPAPTEAKPPKWNDLEQAILDSLTETPAEWSVTELADEQRRAFNQRRSYATYMTPSRHGMFMECVSMSLPFAELGDAVSPEFREKTANIFRQMWETQQAEKTRQKNAKAVAAARIAFDLQKGAG